jgi:carbonic anhydrase/acetyltransferase-like protein (isoleucine patch superfamily)
MRKKVAKVSDEEGSPRLRPNVKTSWVDKPVFPKVSATSHVDPSAVIIGDVTIGEHVNIAPGAIIRADEGMPIVIGDESNIQDGVIIHSLKGEGVTIGKRVSLAHRAIIHGPANIGDGSFIGFGSIVYRCNIGDNCVILHNVVVTDSSIPNGKFLASCSLVHDNSNVESLPNVTKEYSDFASHVVEVNKELAVGNIIFEQKQIERKNRGESEKNNQSKKVQKRELWQWIYKNLKI